ncbi:hypothetical protein P9112_000702 [Eukaryota sp. TZLM1-RC]
MHPILFLAVLFITAASAGCICPTVCGGGYHRSQSECFCWCQNTANRLAASNDARCSYFPSSTFSTGGCSLCASSINSVDSSPESLYEDSPDDSVLPIIDANSRRVFPIERCVCPNECGLGYSGSYAQCSRWAQTKASFFLGDYTLNYFPQGWHSRGGCSACGNMDPCRPI